MRRSQNTSPAELQSLLLIQIIPVFGIQNTISECLARAHAEKVSGQTSTITVDIIQRWALRRSHAGAHGAHGETHAFVGVDEVGEDFRGCGDGDAAFVTEFVKTALHA